MKNNLPNRPPRKHSENEDGDVGKTLAIILLGMLFLVFLTWAASSIQGL